MSPVESVKDLTGFFGRLPLFVDSAYSSLISSLSSSIQPPLRRFRPLFVDSVLSSSIPSSLRRFHPLFVDSILSSSIQPPLRRFRPLFVDSASSSSIPSSLRRFSLLDEFQPILLVISRHLHKKERIIT